MNETDVFKTKLGIATYVNMLNSMVMFNFFQATKFSFIKITSFRYSYFIARVTKDNTSVPSFH